jgi:hypothetical protein
MTQGGKTAAPTAWKVDFKGRATRDAMLAGIASVFAFPAHFGGNLDALYDCLTDLPLKAGTRYSVTLSGLARTPAGDAVHAAFADAAEFWRERRVVFDISRD